MDQGARGRVVTLSATDAYFLIINDRDAVDFEYRLACIMERADYWVTHIARCGWGSSDWRTHDSPPVHLYRAAADGQIARIVKFLLSPAMVDDLEATAGAEHDDAIDRILDLAIV